MEANMGLVRMLAGLIWSGRPKSCMIDLDDMVQLGALGLMQAIESYDRHKGCTFRVYAQYRIKGAILDAIRGQRKEAEHAELTDEMLATTPSMDDMIDARRMLAQLPERERIILEMRYIHGHNLAVIGGKVGRTPQRAGQIARDAFSTLQRAA